MNEEREACENLHRTSYVQMMAARLVSADIPREEITKQRDSDVLREENNKKRIADGLRPEKLRILKVETIHLWDHEWALSEIEGLPRKMGHPDEEDMQPAVDEEDRMIDTPRFHVFDTPRSPMSGPFVPSTATATPDPNSRWTPPSTQHAPARDVRGKDVVGAQNPGRIDRGPPAAAVGLDMVSTISRKDIRGATGAADRDKGHPRSPDSESKVPDCVSCYNRNKACTGGTRCLQCWEARYSCFYRACVYGAECQYPRCSSVHPGQEVVDGKKLDVEPALPRGRKRRQ